MPRPMAFVHAAVVQACIMWQMFANDVMRYSGTLNENDTYFARCVGAQLPRRLVLYFILPTVGAPLPRHLLAARGTRAPDSFRFLVIPRRHAVAHALVLPSRP